MPNQLRVEYRPDYRLLILLLSFFPVYIFCLSILNPDRVYLAILVAAGALLLVYHCCLINSRDIKVLRFDGKEWLAEINGLPVALELQPSSFVSRFLLVAVFSTQAGKKKYRLFFTRFNCNEADFRHLCRILLSR